jgi:soluble lytic murein transglycosylase
MHLRPAAAICTLLLSLPAAGSELRTPNGQPLAAAAEQMKLKNYSAATRFAAETPESGQRDLLLGMAAFKGGQSDAAALLLGKAAGKYPLLADYALYYQAKALLQGNRPQEALQPLKILLKEYPDSPLVRRSLQQQADILFTGGSYAEAYSLYQKFIEKYAAGDDALHALYRSALCREQIGDLPGAVNILRSLWLNSPASAEAARAEQDLQRLAASGTAVAAYTPQELYKRGNTLYDLRSYDAALKMYRSVTVTTEKQDFSDRLRLKIGQALLKARRYQEAEQGLKELAVSTAKAEIRSEAAWLQARAIEKSGRDEEAFTAYSRVATLFPESAEADDALLDAVFIRKFQNRPAESVALLGTLLEKYPKTSLKQRILWESGWGSYLTGNYQAAAEQFRKLLSSDDYRERALYWQGRSLAAAGELAGAAENHALLLKEFPYGFYALQLKNKNGAAAAESLPRLTADFAKSLPLPDAYERVKSLIALGLLDDAALELAASRKKLGKGRSDAGLARLYLEIGNYNGAMSIYKQGQVKPAPDDLKAWSLLYPQAYRELITKYAEQAGIDPSLAYAVMRAESAFIPSAKSPVGARGLMQLMPDTAAAVMHTKKIDPEKLYDPELNIRLGSKHLRELLDKYNGNRIAVIASYNAGAHNVNRWLKTYAGLPDEDFIESIPFGETRDYVKKVLASAALYQQLYGMK